jgi:hypothetical protein
MSLTDTQIQNAKPGLRLVRQSNKDEKSPSPKHGKAKGQVEDKESEAAKNKAPQFIATQKPSSESRGLPASGKLDF